MPSADWIKCCIPFFLNYQKLLQNVNVVLNVCKKNKFKKKLKSTFFLCFIFFILKTHTQHLYNI